MCPYDLKFVGFSDFFSPLCPLGREVVTLELFFSFKRPGQSESESSKEVSGFWSTTRGEINCEVVCIVGSFLMYDLAYP